MQSGTMLPMAMKPIRLQFVCEKAISSQVIAWFSAGHFSHVDAVLDGGMLLGARSDSIGGRPPGVQIRPPEYIKFSLRVVMAIPASDAQSEAFYAFLQRQVGKPYDSEAIWAFFFNRDWRETDSWICSELQAAGLEHAAITPRLYLAANKITPVSLALAASAVGGAAL
jgi:hypothetical protein